MNRGRVLAGSAAEGHGPRLAAMDDNASIRGDQVPTVTGGRCSDADDETTPPLMASGGVVGVSSSRRPPGGPGPASASGDQVAPMLTSTGWALGSKFGCTAMFSGSRLPSGSRGTLS